MMSVTNVNHPSGASRKDGIFPVGHMLPFSLVTSLFFMWGVPHNLNDILIRQFMKSFALSRFEAGLVQSAFYLGYFLVAIPAALLIRQFTYKIGILVGLALYSTGTFLFWPAAIEGKYLYFLGALFVIASGLAFRLRRRRIRSLRNSAIRTAPRDASTFPRHSIRSAQSPAC